MLSCIVSTHLTTCSFSESTRSKIGVTSQGVTTNGSLYTLFILDANNASPFQ